MSDDPSSAGLSRRPASRGGTASCRSAGLSRVAIRSPDPRANEGTGLDPATSARAKLIHDGLVTRGMDSNTAWGFAGNAVRESRADPHSQPGDMGAAHGAFMWRDSPDGGRRLTDYVNKWGHLPEQGSLDEQLDNVMYELNGKEAHAWNSIRRAGNSAGEKGAAVSEFYERPKDTAAEESRRWATSQALAGLFADGGPGAAGANGHVQVDVHLHNAPPGTTATVVASGAVPRRRPGSKPACRAHGEASSRVRWVTDRLTSISVRPTSAAPADVVIPEPDVHRSAAPIGTFADGLVVAAGGEYADSGHAGPLVRRSSLAVLLIHPYIEGELGGVMSDTWTIAEAAMIIKKPSQLLQKTVERAPVKPALARRGGRRVYIFEMRDLVFFCALDDLKDGITSNKQVEVYKALKSIPTQAAIGSIDIGSLRYDFKPYVRRVKRNIEGNRETLAANRQDCR